MHLEAAKTWEAIAAGQYGLLSRKQAEDVGLTPVRIKRLVARGSWIRALPKVYRAAAAPQSWRQPLMAAFLWAKGKAVISGQSAAALWEFDGYWRTRVELSGLADLSAPPGVVYRRVSRLAPADIATHSGIRVTSVARTILDLAALVPRRTLERTLDEALRKDQVTLKAMRWCIERNGRRGRGGVADLEALLHERRLQHAPDSVLESDVAALLRENRLPQPVKRYRVFEGDLHIAEVDLAWPSKRVAIQVHGAGFHRQLRTWEDDQRIENLLQLHGWLVVKVTARMLREDPEIWVEAVRRAVSSRSLSGHAGRLLHEPDKVA